MKNTYLNPSSIHVSTEIIPKEEALRDELHSKAVLVSQFALYGIHLIDGTVFEVLEDISSPAKMTLPEEIAAHKDEDLLCLGDPFNGFNFIPRRSILYVSRTEVQKLEDVLCPFRIFNKGLPS